jgi:hypothetical protein
MHQSLPTSDEKKSQHAGGLWLGFVWPPTQGNLIKGPSKGAGRMESFQPPAD